MSYKVRYPSAALSPYIKQYWAMEGTVPADTGHIQRIVPSGFADLIFYFGDLPVNISRADSPSARSVLNGQQSDFYDLKVTGKLDMLSVTFTPQGSGLFFNLPPDEFFNRNLPLKDIAGPTANRLEELLFDAHSIESRIFIIEKFFTRMLGYRKHYGFRRIADSISMINLARGITNVDDLASRACLSRRQFERTFTVSVGIGPKQFLRVVRFQNAISLRQKNPSATLTEIAYQSGFSDQSHMVREFRTISGHTPGSYFSECEPVSDYFS